MIQMVLNAIDKKLLETVADLHDVPQGAFNIRKNGGAAGRKTTANIDIRTKEDKQGIDVIVKPGTKNESVHIPVIVTETGVEDMVYNTFDIGEDADVLIVAGCGIHNMGDQKAEHDGIHEFFIRRGARIRYVEKHYGEGNGTGRRILNPTTIIHLEEGATAEMELVQIKGVDETNRPTKAILHENSSLIMVEKLLTHRDQKAESDVVVEMIGEGANAHILSRSVAQGQSEQVFKVELIAKEKTKGHVECNTIIMDKAKAISLPGLHAMHSDAELTHEAAIGKIAGDQVLKLMSLGLDEQEAVQAILNGFLK